MASQGGSGQRQDRTVRLLAGERWLRTHPGFAGAVTIGFFLVVGAVHLRVGVEFPLAITFAAPLAFCTYGVGLVAGSTAGVAVATIWLADALAFGMPWGDALPLFASRLFSNLAIVVLSAVTASTVRTHVRLLETQHELVRLRADLVSAFAHDLRTPLAVITGYAELLASDPEDDAAARREATGRILANAARLNQLVADMLAAGDMDRTAPLDVTTIHPAEFVAALRAELDDAPRGHDVAVLWEIGTDTPPLATDRSKLASIVRNLVGNALKFTDQGRVVVRWAYDTAAAAHRIAVEDTGPGIPADALPHVFDRFYRATTSRARSGFGLGLFIVQRLTDLLGGGVTVTSEPGRGTRFVVTLPAAVAPTGGPHAA
jgi:signal transduction histidine kinase